MTNFYHPPVLFCSCQVPPRPPRHGPRGEKQEGKDQRQGQLCVPKAPQNTGTIEASSSQTLLKLLWGLCVLPHAAGVVEWVAMSLRWVYNNCRFGQRGIIHLHIQEMFYFPLSHPSFLFLPLSCHKPAVLNWQHLLPSPCSESPSLKHNNGCWLLCLIV